VRYHQLSVDGRGEVRGLVDWRMVEGQGGGVRDGSVVGEGCVVGEGSVVGERCVVREGSVVGQRVGKWCVVFQGRDEGRGQSQWGSWVGEWCVVRGVTVTKSVDAALVGRLGGRRSLLLLGLFGGSADGKSQQ